MAKKKRVGLPRVTVLAMDKRALLAFVSAVETLRLLVDDLRAVAVDLSNAAIRQAKGTKAKRVAAVELAAAVEPITPEAAAMARMDVAARFAAAAAAAQVLDKKK